MGNDVIMYYIRAQEVDTNSTERSHLIMAKPESDWSPLDSQLNMIACYLGAISISFIITSLLALQAYWNHLMEQLSRRQFISAWEYWTYLTLAVILIPVFPILVVIFVIFKSNPSYQVDIPQLISSSLTFMIFLLGLRTQFGISKLIKTPTRIISQNQGKLKYFQDLNVWLIMSLFIWSISYLFLIIDKLFISKEFLDNSRFIIDFLSVNANFGRLFVYITLILIVYPDFPIDTSSSPKRQISKPMNVIKHDIPNLDELIYQSYVSVDISTTSEKQASSKLTKKNSKNSKSKLPFSKSINDEDLPTFPLRQKSLIDEALQQQIVVEMTSERTVEPAYMHSYINPHVPHRNNLQSPTPSNRPNSDLLAPLPSPNSEFAVSNNRFWNSNNQGRSLFFQNNNQRIAPDSEEIINNSTRSDQNYMNRINQGQNFVSINVNEQNNLGDVKRDQYNQKDRTGLNIDTNVRNNTGGKQNDDELLHKYKKGFV
ncbi:10606_t:CDS:2 [Gigaspora rosea]|nr:10606_t:CDS:2 [Gigaspora rosea]